MSQFDQIVSNLKAKKSGTGYIACCPAHNDKNPSLSMSAQNGKTLLKCHAGCSQEAVIAALKAKGLWTEAPALKFTKTDEYFYFNELGEKRLRVERLEAGSGKKKFIQSRWNGSSWVHGKGPGSIAPYRFESWNEKPGPIYIVEGEKCVHALENLGLKATTTPGGAESWGDEFAPFFKGREVVVLPDNDAPGAKYGFEIARSVYGVAANLKLVNLPGLADAEDAVDWLSRNSAEDMFRLVQQAPVLRSAPKKPSKWICVSEELDRAPDYRKQVSKNKIDFGVRVVDMGLGGIMQNDLVLITAPPGSGKTEFVSTIAANVISQNKKVYMFALEAEPSEITNRITYKHLAKEYYSDPEFRYVRTERRLNYMDWFEGLYDEVLRHTESRIMPELRFQYENLFVRYKEDEDFDIKKLKLEILDVYKDADLIIIDHIHFIDLDDANENRAMTEVLSTLRKLSISIGKPIIVVAHLRKSDSRSRSLVPNLEDIHGTSNLAKICTKAIILAPAKSAIHDPKLYPTYFRIAKNRRDGSRTRFTALVDFNISTNSYNENFTLGQLINDGSEFEPITSPDLLPYWAKGNK